MSSALDFLAWNLHNKAMATSNILDYLRWRGDLTLAQDSFNSVDNLLFSTLAYLPFSKVCAPAERITLDSLALRFQSLPLEPGDDPRNRQQLEAMGKSRRFGSMQVFGCHEEFSEAQEKQYASFAIDTGYGATCLSYRGTDTSLVGLKEDFNMGFLSVIPGQVTAAKYLVEIAAHTKGPLLLVGHSKGGNLAVYAAMHAPTELKKRIIAVYNNDGPGFEQSVLDSDGYHSVLDRVHTFVPQSSIVGMLLNHAERYTVVHSTQSGGIMQHDPYTWEVIGNNFICNSDVDLPAKYFDRTLKNWLSEVSPTQRGQFIDTVYRLFFNANIRSINQIQRHWFLTSKALVMEIKDLDKDTRRMLLSTVEALFSSAHAVALDFSRRPQALPDLKQH